MVSADVKHHVYERASTRKATDSLRSLSDNTFLQFLRDNEKISQTTIGAWTRYFSCLLDDIKVFEPSGEGDSTVQVTVRCYRSMRKND